MKKVNVSKIGIWFAIAGLLLLIYNWYRSDYDNSLDINLHSTYFVISHPMIRLLLGFVLLFFAGIYFLFSWLKKPLHRGLGYIHLVLSIMALSLVYKIRLQPQRRRYFSPAYEKKPLIDWTNFDVINMIVTISFFIFCIGLSLLLINMAITLLKKKKVVS